MFLLFMPFRWAQEGHLPLFGAYKILPDGTKLINKESMVLDKIGKNGPSILKIRRNTSSILHLLGVSQVLQPPVHVVARRIVRDLQLPDELSDFVRKLDKLVGNKRGKWRLKTFGNHVDIGTGYAAALILFALKLTLGLDGTSEHKISSMAAEANEILRLKPSSSFAKNTQGPYVNGDASGQPPTIFVWKEWVRFMRYRRLILETEHVPTAIRHKALARMDPDIVMAFARGKGYLSCKNVKKLRPSRQKSQEDTLELLEDIMASRRQEKSTTVPIAFKPTVLPRQGLAEQLYEKYGLLRQDFPSSSLKPLLQTKTLASALQQKDVGLDVCQGPAYDEVDLLGSQFVPLLCRTAFKRKRGALGRPTEGPAHYAYKTFRRCHQIRAASGSGQQKKLVLFQPWQAYWSLSIRGTAKLTQFDWKVLSAQLPPTFLWMLNEVAESCGEKPMDLYAKLQTVETILLRYCQRSYSLVPQDDLKWRIASAKKVVL